MKSLPRRRTTVAVLAALLSCACFVHAQTSPQTAYGKILREIRFEGVRYTDVDVITRELASKVGEPYLEENAKKDFARLDGLDICSNIQMRAREDSTGVILTIRARELYPYMPFFSYEVSDENGFSIGPGFQSVSLLRRDIFFSGVARFGGATNINLFINNPWVAGNHLSYTLNFFQRDRFNKVDEFNEIATELYVTLASYLGESGRIGGRFAFQSVKSDVPGRTLSADNRDNVATVALFLGYDSRDLWSNPHNGWWNEIEVSQVGGLWGDGDFWRVNLDVRRYLPVLPRHTLALFSLVTLSSGTRGEDFAAWQDFSLGGTNSVRGWELGSRHGKNQMLSTAEYRVTVLEPRLLTLPFGLTLDVGVEVSAFGDLGAAWDERREFAARNFIGGYGLGVRLLVPFVNMFRFDFALGESGKSVQLNIGAFSKAVAQRFRVR